MISLREYIMLVPDSSNIGRDMNPLMSLINVVMKGMLGTPLSEMEKSENGLAFKREKRCQNVKIDYDWEISVTSVAPPTWA